MAKPLGSISWDVSDTKFFVNTEGCGYPPTVNCSDFAKKYGYSNMGKIFPCYYSRTHPETVVARYNHSIIFVINTLAKSQNVLCFQRIDFNAANTTLSL